LNRSELEYPHPLSSPSGLQFLRFAIVGAAGFVVDAGSLHLVVHELGVGLYTGRLMSYLTAATFTWALNRRYTFHAQRDHNPTREWLRFLAANAAGGLLNYTVYVVLISAFEIVARWPVIGVAAGSMAGLIANFVLSKRLVFKRRR
jgi:putative flippase GtrA